MTEFYARLYYRFPQEFPAVYADDHQLAWWARLLMVADASWPMRPPIPRAVPGLVLGKLVAAGLVIPDGTAYTVRGLDAERTRRSNAGRKGAAVRWQSDRISDGNAVGNAIAMPTRAEQSRAKQSDTARGLPNLTDTVAKEWEKATGRGVLASGTYAAEYLDEACRRRPTFEVAAAVIRARKQFTHIPDAASMVSAMRPILDPFPDAKAAAKAEREREAAAASRRGTAATLRRNHELGAHRGEPHGACPVCQEATA